MSHDQPRDLTYFVSYARADRDQARRLLELIQVRLAIVKGYRFTHWIDDQIGVGEHWNEAIDAALTACDFGLLLLSPAFFASGFIRREELPHFIEQVCTPDSPPDTRMQTRIRKPLVPVLLKPVPLDGSADLAGLEQIQIFRNRDARSFSEGRGNMREAFVDQLVAALLAKLRRLYPATG